MARVDQKSPPPPESRPERKHLPGSGIARRYQVLETGNRWYGNTRSNALLAGDTLEAGAEGVAPQIGGLIVDASIPDFQSCFGRFSGSARAFCSGRAAEGLMCDVIAEIW